MRFYRSRIAPLALLLVLLVANWALISSVKEHIRPPPEEPGSSLNQGAGEPGFMKFPGNLTFPSFPLPFKIPLPIILIFPNYSTSAAGQSPGGSSGIGQGGTGSGQGREGGGSGSGATQASTGTGSTQAGQGPATPRERHESPRRVIELNPVLLIVLMSLILAVLAAASIPRAIAVLQRRRTKREKEAMKREKPPAAPVLGYNASSMPVFPVAEAPRIKLRLLKLSIPEDMPPIWAPNEPLRFEVPQGTVVRVRPAAEIGADYIKFPREGCYEVEASLGNIVDNVTVKVVDYVEEASRMISANFGSDPEKTVRELAVKVSSTRNIDISKLKPVVTLFEEALYGERGLNRAGFEAFYRGLVSAFDRVRWVPCEEIGYFHE
jgi:hypothetical protein